MRERAPTLKVPLRPFGVGVDAVAAGSGQAPRKHLHLAQVPEPSECLLAGVFPCIRRVAYLKVMVFSVR